ncbi:MAG: DUF2853 family protein [Saprospiraceae bacterium]|nr:DUF2853 family protein [Bacteroidia bacterium]NNK90755.1 DUF2853 family protein [Saprospiraceae bacterium]
MSKFQECMDTFDKEFNKLGIKYDAAMLAKVAKACGPSLYSSDASKVAASDKKELERIKKNFLIKKLGLKDTPKLDEGMADVITQIGKSNRNKYRAMFYYLLAKRFRKSGVFK